MIHVINVNSTKQGIVNSYHSYAGGRKRHDRSRNEGRTKSRMNGRQLTWLNRSFMSFTPSNR